MGAGCEVGVRMTNIPTDLLRTFVLVVELRSFTRAARAQGMTQPAVSAQIRRLQGLLGGVELFDKSAPGVTLTVQGKRVIDSARRLLSVNDQIVQIAGNGAAEPVRIGVRKDWMGDELMHMLAAARSRWPNLRFAVQGAGQQRLLRYLKDGEVDVVVTLAPDDPSATARHAWTEELAWVRGKATAVDLNAPIPLVSYKDGMRSRIAMAILARANLVGELVFRATDAYALHSAVMAGLGVMLMPRRHIPAGLEAWDDGPLPPPPRCCAALFIREGTGDSRFGLLADSFAAALRPDAAGEVALFPPPRTADARYH